MSIQTITEHEMRLTKELADLHMKVTDQEITIAGYADALRKTKEALAEMTANRDEYSREADKLAGELKALRDSGVELPEPFFGAGRYLSIAGNLDAYTADQLRDYGDRRAMAERERAAKVCEDHATKYLNRDVRNQHSHGAGLGASICADAIRKGE